MASRLAVVQDAVAMPEARFVEGDADEDRDRRVHATGPDDLASAAWVEADRHETEVHLERLVGLVDGGDEALPRASCPTVQAERRRGDACVPLRAVVRGVDRPRELAPPQAVLEAEEPFAHHAERERRREPARVEGMRALEAGEGGVVVACFVEGAAAGVFLLGVGMGHGQVLVEDVTGIPSLLT